MFKHKKLKNLVKYHVLSGISDHVSTSGTFLMLPYILFLLQKTATTIFYCWAGVIPSAPVSVFFKQMQQRSLYYKQQYFSFIRSQHMSPKVKVFAPVCICKLQSDFLCFFWSICFLLAEGSFSSPWYWAHFTVNNERVLCQHLHKVFGFFSEVILHSQHIDHVSFLSEVMVGHSNHVYTCVQLFEQMMWQLQVSEKNHNSLPNIWGCFM